MRKVITLAFAITAVLAVAAVAVAQYALPVVQASGSVTPIKKSDKDPKGKKYRKVVTSFLATINKESHVTAKTITIEYDKNVTLSGKGFPVCTYATLSSKGASACPKGSEVGSGGSKAVLGPNQTPLTFKVRLFNSGATDLSLLLNGSVSVPAPLKGKLSNGGRRLTISVPPEVQQPVKGLYADVTELSGKIDGVSKKGVGYAREKKCGAHRVTVTVEFAPNPGTPPQPASGSGSTKNTCKK